MALDQTAAALPQFDAARVARTRSDSRRFRLTRRTTAILIGQVALVVVILGVVEWLVDSGTVDPIYLASPSQVIANLPNLVVEQNLFGNLLVTLGEAIAGVAAAFVLGVSTGLWMGLSLSANRFLNPFVAAAMAVPKVTIIPLLTLYFGIGVLHKVVIVFLFGYFLFVYNTIAGIRQVQESQVKVTRAFGASRGQVVTKVILPSAAASIMAAVRVETGTALVAALFAEIVASKAGLGNLLNRAFGLYDTPSIFGLVLVITIVSVLLIAAVNLLERTVLLKWKHQ